MEIFLTTRIPIESLREKSVVELCPADFLLDDLVEIYQNNETCAVNSKQLALSKKERGEAKYLYKLSIEQL